MAGNILNELKKAYKAGFYMAKRAVKRGQEYINITKDYRIDGIKSKYYPNENKKLEDEFERGYIAGFDK